MVDPAKDKDSGINKLIKVLSQDRRFLSEAWSTVVQLKWKPKLSTAIELTTMLANCRMMSMLYPIFYNVCLCFKIDHLNKVFQPFF